MNRSTTMLLAALALLTLTACGGGDADPQVFPHGLAVVGLAADPYCPADPATFVGPLPQACLTARDPS